MSVRDTRRQNLIELLSETSQREFADRAGLAPGHVSQMVNGSRQMGESVARRIEKQCTLPSGWMDVPHSENATIEQVIQLLAPIAAEERSRVLRVVRALVGAPERRHEQRSHNGHDRRRQPFDYT